MYGNMDAWMEALALLSTQYLGAPTVPKSVAMTDRKECDSIHKITDSAVKNP